MHGHEMDEALRLEMERPSGERLRDAAMCIGNEQSRVQRSAVEMNSIALLRNRLER